MWPGECNFRMADLILKLFYQYLTNIKTVLCNSWIEDYIQPAIEKNEVENFEETLKKTRGQIEKKIAHELDAAKKSDIDGNDPDETETEDSGDDDNYDVNKTKQSGDRSKGKISGKTVPRNAKSTKAKKKFKKKNAEEDLIAAIRNKNGRGNPLASIAARYGVSSVENDPLDDGTFQKLQSKYSKKKG